MDAPRPAFTRQWTADNGDGTFTNPLLNADFPDPDIIRVDDTYYMVSTTMFYFPGATILKSKDLVNWEYCSNPLLQINSSDPYNLQNGYNHYAKGQWAASLKYHDGKFYLHFIAFNHENFQDGGDFLLTAENPEGTWEMRKLDGFYYDAGLLFDDGENGTGNTYIAYGIGDISVTQLDEDFKAVRTEKVIGEAGEVVRRMVDDMYRAPGAFDWNAYMELAEADRAGYGRADGRVEWFIYC